MQVMYDASGVRFQAGQQAGVSSTLRYGFLGLMKLCVLLNWHHEPCLSAYIFLIMEKIFEILLEVHQWVIYHLVFWYVSFFKILT
jgi:hypothetical protein